MKSNSLLRLSFLLLGIFSVFTRPAAAQNFTLAIEPDSVTLVPGETASFVVSCIPSGGFSTNVTFSTTNLPSGVTASFSPNPIKPPGTSLLTLTAATNAATGGFTLNVTAIGGGVTNTTSSSVTVNFGLLPLCFGSFTGQVTDEETSLPVAGATIDAIFGQVFTATTDANGFFTLTNLSLGLNNTAALYNLSASASNYWQSVTAQTFAVCDATNVVNLQVLKKQFGSASGTVTAQGGGPLANVNVTYAGPSFGTVQTDAGGNYTITNLALNFTNAPANYAISAQPAGFWRLQSNAPVQAGSNTVVDLTLVPICFGTITGTVVFGDTLLPAPNIQVSVGSGLGSLVTTNTDANGNYTLPNVALGNDNTTLNAIITAFPGGNYFSASTNVSLAVCGSTVAAPAIALPPVPRNNFGAVTGHVFDLMTHLPIAGAFINSGSAVTDSNGAYLYTNIFLGTGNTTNITAGITAGATGYFTSLSNVVINAGQTSTQDLFLVKVGHGFIIGTLRDSATTLPITNVNLSISSLGAVFTDSNGNYNAGPIPLNVGNGPTLVSIFTQPPGYYEFGTNITITNGLTNVVDIDLLKICTSATIIGNVVSTTTQQPITNATVFVSGFPSKTTDTNGNFVLTNIAVGNNNSPIQVTVNASAPGFNSQAHTVTVFCDAVITTEFGAPETEFGTIQGVVTNLLTGEPLNNVFIGSGFGGSTFTDTNGFYQLLQVPLGANGSDISWTVTAIPTNFNAQTLFVGVSSNSVSTLNFGFGAPPTHLLVTETSAPNPVLVGSNLVYTIVLTNTASNAANIVLSVPLDPSLTFLDAILSNSVGGSFTTPALSNGVVTATSSNLNAGGGVALVITVTPTVAGNVTNTVTVTSSTADTDPAGTNRTATVTDSVNAPASLHADLAVGGSPSPNPVLVSNQVTFSFSVTNLGPNDAPDVLLDSTLPANTSFVSSGKSQGVFTQNGNALHWDFGAIANQGKATASITLTPLVAGLVNDVATVSIGPGSLVTDNNQANDAATLVATVNSPPLTNVTVQSGAVAFDPQTGLFEQSVVFHNLSGATAAAVRISAPGLPSSVVLYNASGKTNGVPFVEYDQTVASGASVTFVLEYYNSSRKAFSYTNFTAAAVVATAQATPTGTTLLLDQNPVLINGEVLIEFVSIPGDTYVIQYGPDGQNWTNAVPPVVAAGTRVQWIDAGPPKTISAPMSVGQRFYRVIQTSGN